MKGGKQIVGAKGLSTAFFVKYTLTVQERLANQRGCTTNEVEQAWFQVSHKIPGCVPNIHLGVEACTHTNTDTHIYICAHTCCLCYTHIHTVLLLAERETPAFPGQFTHRRTGVGLKLISSANQKHRSHRAAVHGGTSAPLVECFTHLLNWLPSIL